jgi:hypothetical protein
VLDSIVKFFTSLKLTVVCLTLAMVLVFIGTMAQVDLGIHAAQQKYFQSLFIYWSPPNSTWKIPCFPGGHLIGGVLFINLIVSHVYRFRLSWKQFGINLIHFGIFLLLLGGLLTDLLSVESQMRIHTGETKNYSESVDRVELAVIDTSRPDFDEVVSIPDRVLAHRKIIQHPRLPFRLNVVNFFPNSDIIPMSENKMIANSSPSVITQGLGKNFVATEAPPVTKMNEADIASAIIEVVPVEGSLGTWLCSTAIGQRQSLSYQDKTYQIQLRPMRIYRQYGMKLLKFSHDKYAGTEIPKNFSSKIHLKDSIKKEDREVLIYMNNPLRYEGDTFYQAGFEKDNTTTVLQVVHNPSWVTPYLACSLVGIGLVVQFSMHLFKFDRKRKA